MDIGEQIKAHRKAQKMTLTELEKRTGIGNGNLSRLERNKQSLTNETMTLIAEAFGISLAELFTEYCKEVPEGHKQSRDEPKIAIPVTNYRYLIDIPKGAIVLINSVQVANRQEEGACWARDQANMIPFIGESIRELGSSPADLLSLCVKDDAMQPRLFTGDFVVVDSSDTEIPDTGGVFAVLIDGRTIAVRRLFRRPGGAMMVVCDNKTYPDITLSASEANYITIIGRAKSMRGNSGF